jgi:hypothetical protein
MQLKLKFSNKYNILFEKKQKIHKNNTIVIKINIIKYFINKYAKLFLYKLDLFLFFKIILNIILFKLCIFSFSNNIILTKRK